MTVYIKYNMRSATLKWIVLLSTVVVAIIVIVQLYFLNKLYSLDQKQFDTNIMKAVRVLFDDMQLSNNPDIDLKKTLEHPDQNTFLVRVDKIPSKEALLHFIENEFEDFGVLSDCRVAVHDGNSILFTEYIAAAASHNPVFNGLEPALTPKGYPYIHLYFPHREKFIIGELTSWIIGAVFLVIVLIGFAVSLFFLYKQKTLNEIQKDFVNNFTHEFKTPLAVMKIASDVMINPAILKQPERLKKYSLIIKEQTEHLQHQVERLLKTATSDNQKLHLEKESFNLTALIEDVLHLLDPMIIEKAVKVELDLDEKDDTVVADRSHFAMVLVNLLENAIKYSTDPHVLIKTMMYNDGFSISVKDNGIGIEKQYTKLLFRKFFRVPTGDVHNVKGFGLGLNFVKKVIDSHHGKIIVNSLPGIGTEFKISLPNQ